MTVAFSPRLCVTLQSLGPIIFYRRRLTTPPTARRSNFFDITKRNQLTESYVARKLQPETSRARDHLLLNVAIFRENSR
jgi:hypothetical protein